MTCTHRLLFLFIGSDELERWEDEDQTEEGENPAHHIVSRQAPAAQQARNNRVTDSSFSTPSLQELEQPNTGSPVRSVFFPYTSPLLILNRIRHRFGSAIVSVGAFLLHENLNTPHGCKVIERIVVRNTHSRAVLGGVPYRYTLD